MGKKKFSKNNSYGIDIVVFNSRVKIAGTKYDRRLKINLDNVESLKYDYDNRKYLGLTLREIAEKYGISTTSVLYRCKPGYKEKSNKKRVENAKNENGKYRSYDDLIERTNYKLKLVEDGLVPKPVVKYQSAISTDNPEEAFKQIQELRKLNHDISKLISNDSLKTRINMIIDNEINNLKTKI